MQFSFFTLFTSLAFPHCEIMSNKILWAKLDQNYSWKSCKVGCKARDLLDCQNKMKLKDV